MFAGGVGRIFREFDEFLDITYAKRATGIEATIWKKKNRKRLTNLLENFLEETACLLNIDRGDFDKGELPWGLIFYNRMLSTKNLVNVERHALYTECFNDYAEIFKDSKPKEIKKKRAFIKSVHSLVDYLKMHSVDPDNVLIGLSPSASVLERYEEWLQLHKDLKKEAQQLSEQEGNSDPLSLYFVGYPAKKGDLVIAQVSLDKVTTVDLRARALHNQERRSVIQFARIKEAVEFNKKTFLTIWIAPKEEQEITVPADACVPMRNLVPGQAWIGNAELMREMVADPYMEFTSGLNSLLISSLEERLTSYQLPVTKIYTALQHQPVPFYYYHYVNALTPIIDCFSPGADCSNFEGLDIIRDDFVRDSIKTTKDELERLIDEINDPDGTSNKLFMPTCDKDLMKLHTLDVADVIQDFIKKFQFTCHQAVSAFESEKKELMKGNLKNQISKWWLLLIKTRSELILAQTHYDPNAWNEDTYIDVPPTDLEKVRENLLVVQDLLNPKHPSHEIVTEATEDIKNEVYPVIDDFIMKAHVVLSHDLLGEEINLEYSAESFDLEKVRSSFDSQKEKILAMENGEEYYKQLDGLMKDLKYLVEMKNLEYRTAADRGSTTGGKLELSYAVPLSGLVMGSFFRLENILKTVLELWAPKTMKIPSMQASTPSEPPPSNSTVTEDTQQNSEDVERPESRSAPSSARKERRLSSRPSPTVEGESTPTKRRKRRPKEGSSSTETSPRRRKKREGDGERKKKSKKTPTDQSNETPRRKKKRKRVKESVDDSPPQILEPVEEAINEDSKDIPIEEQEPEQNEQSTPIPEDESSPTTSPPVVQEEVELEEY